VVERLCGLLSVTRCCPLSCLFRAPAGKVFPLGEFAAAVAESQQVGRLGKVLLKLH
jgi:hypothetical protein